MAFGRCRQCGEALPPRGKSGPARVYCSGRCRMEAHRDRLAGSVSGSAAFEPAGPVPPPAEGLVPPVVLDVPVEDQLARAILEARTLADGFDRLAPLLPPQLGSRASRLAGVIHAGLNRWFGGIG